jgi:hypothetical protein
MSDCCLPNLGCLSIPVTYVDVAGQPGQPGTPATVTAGDTFGVPYGDPASVVNTSANPSAAVFDFYIPAGEPGATGGVGTPGVSRLYSNTSEQFSSLLNQFVQLYQYTIPANTLVDNGDSLVINLRSTKLTSAGVPFTGCLRRIKFNATSCTIFGGFEVAMITADTNGYQYNTRVEIIKIAADEARCLIVSDYDLVTTNIGLQYLTYQNTLTGLDFTTINTISADIYQAAFSQVRLRSITIDKIKAL